MVLIIERNKGIISDIIIIDKSCLDDQFIDKHILRNKWPVSNPVNTCIVNCRELDEENIPIGIPDKSEIIQCLKIAIAAQKILHQDKGYFFINHISFPNLKAREFLFDYKKGFAEPIDNVIFDFKLEINLIEQPKSINKIILELKKRNPKITPREIKIIEQAINGAHTSKGINKKIELLKKENKKLNEDNDIFNALIKVDKEEINHSNIFNDKEKERKIEEIKEFENQIVQNSEKIEEIKTQFNEFEIIIREIESGRIFICSHIHPIREQ